RAVFLDRVRARARRGLPGSTTSAVGPEHAHGLADLRQAAERLRDRHVAELALQVHEKHVAAHALAPGPRLDLDQVDPTPTELVQAAHQPTGAVRARAPEHERCLPPAVVVRA